MNKKIKNPRVQHCTCCGKRFYNGGQKLNLCKECTPKIEKLHNFYGKGEVNQI